MQRVSKQSIAWFVTGVVSALVVVMMMSNGIADAAPPFLTPEDEIDAATLEGAPRSAFVEKSGFQGLLDSADVDADTLAGLDRSGFVEESELAGLVDDVDVDADTLGSLGPDDFARAGDVGQSTIIAAGRVEGETLSSASTPGLVVTPSASNESVKVDLAAAGVEAADCYAVVVTPLDIGTERIDLSFNGSEFRVVGYDMSTVPQFVALPTDISRDINGNLFLVTDRTFTGNAIDLFQTRTDFSFVVSTIPGLDTAECERSFTGG